MEYRGVPLGCGSRYYELSLSHHFKSGIIILMNSKFDPDKSFNDFISYILIIMQFLIIIIWS